MEKENKFKYNRKIVESILKNNIKARTDYQSFLMEFAKNNGITTVTELINSDFNLVSGLRNFQYIQNNEGLYLPDEQVMSNRRKKALEIRRELK